MTLPLRIAVADDELDMRDYFLSMLSRRGHQVVSVAETGLELVEHCRKLKPDLVITDVKMPKLDGMAAADAICAERLVPVILISAHQEEESLPQINRPLIFLRKPFLYSELEAAIEKAMQSLHRLAPSNTSPPSPVTE